MICPRIFWATRRVLGLDMPSQTDRQQEAVGLFFLAAIAPKLPSPPRQHEVGRRGPPMDDALRPVDLDRRPVALHGGDLAAGDAPQQTGSGGFQRARWMTSKQGLYIPTQHPGPSSGWRCRSARVGNGSRHRRPRSVPPAPDAVGNAQDHRPSRPEPAQPSTATAPWPVVSMAARSWPARDAYGDRAVDRRLHGSTKLAGEGRLWMMRCAPLISIVAQSVSMEVSLPPEMAARSGEGR